MCWKNMQSNKILNGLGRFIDHRSWLSTLTCMFFVHPRHRKKTNTRLIDLLRSSSSVSQVLMLWILTRWTLGHLLESLAFLWMMFCKLPQTLTCTEFQPHCQRFVKKICIPSSWKSSFSDPNLPLQFQMMRSGDWNFQSTRNVVEL